MKWLDEIRRKIWPRAKSQAHELPSADAFCLHWRRCVWINHMWSQALQNTIQFLPMDNYGWRINSDILEIVWDSRNLRLFRHIFRLHHCV